MTGTNLQQVVDTGLHLFSKGWFPIPINGKRPVAPNWTQVAREEWEPWFRRWAGRASGVGVRLDGLIAVDIDVDDDDLAQEILARLPCKGQRVRFRQGSSRRLLLYSYDGKARKILTRRYPAGRVELLMGSKFQVAALGPHPKGGEYDWMPEFGVSDSAPHELFTGEWRAGVERVLQRSGPEISAATEGAFGVQRVLNPEMVFTTLEEGELTAQELHDRVAEDRDLQIPCHLDGVRPGSDSGAGLAEWNESEGGLCIVDFVASAVYFAADGTLWDHGGGDPEAQDGLAQIMQGGGGPPDVAQERETRAEALEERRTRYDQHLGDHFWHKSRSKFYRLGDTRLRHGVTMASVAACVGGRQPVQDWFQSEDALIVDGTEFRPDRPTERLLKGPEGLLLNTYLPPEHPTSGGSTETFHAFLARLVPDGAERGVVWRWLAHKVQNPHVRGWSLIMVAPHTYGTGRGQFTDVISRLLGHTLTVSPEALKGRFNGFLAETLVVAVNESDGAGTGVWDLLQQGEKLKALFDPGTVEVSIERKGQDVARERVYVTGLLCTNTFAGYALPQGDRRFGVVENGSPMTEKEVWEFNRWKEEPLNIGALYRELRRVELSSGEGFNPMRPPLTPSKERLLQASAALDETLDLREAWAAYLQEVGSPVWTARHAQLWCLQHDVDSKDFKRAMRRETETWVVVHKNGRTRVRGWTSKGVSPDAARKGLALMDAAAGLQEGPAGPS